MDLPGWITAAAATGQLCLALASALRAGRSPLALPLALFCFDLFAFTAADLAFSLSHQVHWHLLDHAASPWASPLLLHFVLVFTGRRRRFRRLLGVTYAVFGLLSASALAAFVSPTVNAFQSSPDWIHLHVILLLPVVLFATALLVVHLRQAVDPEARQRARLLLAALAIGVPLTVADLLSPWWVKLVGAAVLVAAVLMAVVALRLHLFGQDLSTSVITYAVALAGLVVGSYAALFDVLRESDAVLVLGSATVGLLLAIIIASSAREVARRRARAEELRSLGRFAQQLAHDLKNPLAALKGAVELIDEERRRGGSLEAQGGFLGLMGEQISRMERSLAEFQRLGRVEPALAPLRLDALVEEVTAMERLAAPPGVSLVLALGGPPELAADRDLLARALENLIANAFEAMPDGGTLQVRTSCQGPAALLAIEDSGRGMDPVTAERAFDDFFTTKPQGTGLGLPYARRVALAHGGDLRMWSRPGRGTHVEIRLPLR